MIEALSRCTCDVCGRTKLEPCEEPWKRTQSHDPPTGWARLEMNDAAVPSSHFCADLCPDCASALKRGDATAPLTAALVKLARLAFGWKS